MFARKGPVKVWQKVGDCEFLSMSSFLEMKEREKGLRSLLP